MRAVAALVLAVLVAPLSRAQTSNSSGRAAEIQELRAELARLSARLDALEQSGSVGAAAATTAAEPAPPQPIAPPSPPPPPPGPPVTAAVTTPSPSSSAQAPSDNPASSILPINLPGGFTLNYTLDGYYGYNFNQPPGRVNDLRAYDVLSNTFSINQATVILDLDPDLEQHRRYGVRLDLQYGQATDTLQGNPANEPRPTIYQNIFQAYGTYIVPVGKGLTLDFGKWASSLGVEGNYSKDQADYTRAFYFYFLPFYHQGVRAGYQVNDKLKLNYWLVNGTNQSEPTNGFRDELFGFTFSPTKKITWTSNYYLGQEHADNVQTTGCVIPEQPGLCVSPISPAPNGKLHIFDNYVAWQATPKLTLIGEGDYVIQRLWSKAGPDESAAPQHLDGGAAYANYQLNARTSFAVRGEYMSDRSGLFSNESQAIKEGTATYKHSLADGLDAFLEFRRDWTNIDYFRTHNPNVLANHQSTATLGLVWWYGGKQGSW